MTNRAPIVDPFVSLVLPIWNEAAYLERGLDAIDAQTYRRDRIEIILVDGGSSDGTLEIVGRRMGADQRIRILGGPGVNTPLAMRIGADAAEGDILVKVDGHGWINDQYVAVAVDALRLDPSLGCVGGVIHPVATTRVERAIAIARFSLLGVGSGVYTLNQRVQETDTVQCGAYRRQALDAAGGFDPAMAYGEDEELNHRVRLAGWRILFHPSMRFTYRVRPTLSALFRQYFRYGRARVAVVRKHPSFFRLKHAAPAAAISTLGASLLLVPFPGWRVLTILAWLGYAGVIVAGAVVLSSRHRFGRPDLVAGALVALHTGYGVGSLRGLLDPQPRSADRGPQRVVRATRAGSEGDGVTDHPHPEQEQR